MNRIILTFLAAICLAPTLKAQDEQAKDYLEVGTYCPEIIFKNLKYLPNVTSMEDLRGKWVILDFWSNGCSGCVTIFPKLNEIQKEFVDSLQIVLIGNNNMKNKSIVTMYDKFRTKQNLNLAVAFDSVCFQRFGIKLVPHIVIVDPVGVVQAVTTADKITLTNIRKLISGDSHVFRQNSNASEAQAKTGMERIVGGSFLSSWTIGDKVVKRSRLDYLSHDGIFTVKGVSLAQLYNYAYTGHIDWDLVDSLHGSWHDIPVIESNNKSAFEYNYENGFGLYNYFVKVDKNTRSLHDLQLILQRDLKACFGYEVSIEEREMPIWKLVATDSARIALATKHAKYAYLGDHAGRQLQNASVKHLLEVIEDYNRNQPPMIDETNISSKIDITIDAIMTDLEEIRKSLKDSGLTLELDKKKMKVIVLRDRLPGGSN